MAQLAQQGAESEQLDTQVAVAVLMAAVEQRVTVVMEGQGRMPLGLWGPLEQEGQRVAEVHLREPLQLQTREAREAGLD